MIANVYTVFEKHPTFGFYNLNFGGNIIEGVNIAVLIPSPN